MASLSEIGEAPWTTALDAMRTAVRTAQSIEEAADAVARLVYEHFSDDTVLCRVYASIPYEQLEPRIRERVAEITGDASPAATTPVLTLLGTFGVEAAWRDRKLSQGHAGIPLLSARFVDQIPMIARLLQELGIDLGWLDEADDVRTRRLVGGFNGVFYVEDAMSTHDARGRKVIPAQDFVAAYGVKTVFGTGGFYPDGTLIVGIVFSQTKLDRTTTERSLSLVSMLKGETFGLVRKKQFFR